ncbi:MAG: tetratricopeptide repeat protein [Chloroflexota bacterium]
MWWQQGETTWSIGDSFLLRAFHIVPPVQLINRREPVIHACAETAVLAYTVTIVCLILEDSIGRMKNSLGIPYGKSPVCFSRNALCQSCLTCSPDDNLAVTVNETMLEIRVLGSPQFILSGQPVSSLKSAKSQAILCYLAMTKRPLSRTALGGLLWPDKSDQEARVNLRQSIRRVQKSMPGALLAQRESVALSPDMSVAVDVTQFETAVSQGDISSLEMAIAHYQGDFMAGFYVEDAYDFEEWLLLERERLRAKAVQVLHDLTTHFVTRRETEKGLRYARQLLGLEPWLEEGHRALMRLLAWQGQYNSALKQYATCRKLLDEELGVEPSPETAALFDRIRQLRTASRPLLPQESFPLVGRVADMTTLNQMLHDPNRRLVTLTGPGGMGKTRLILAVAQQQTNLFLDGVYWVDLAEVLTGDGLITAVMTQLGTQMGGSAPPKTQLINYLRGKEVLLLLDNFEQLTTDRQAVAFISELLRAAPELVLLVTSRVRLNLQQEQVYRLDNLPFPAPNTPLDKVADYPAVALFAETARWGRPDWDFGGEDEEEKTAVVRICQLVEGLPLGLKMAAALTQAQSCVAIAAAVAENLDSLASDMADLPPRQRSLRAAFDYSLRLLPAAERDLFLQLSIFRGGFTREAVQTIVAANPHLLTRLVSHSLLTYQSGDRYTIHAVVRQFAAEARRAAASIDDAKGALPIAQRYAAFYLTFLADRQVSLQGESPQMAAAEIDDEIENVRQAWRLGLAQQQFGDILGSLHAFSTFFQLRGRSHEAKELLGLAAQQVEPSAAGTTTAARLLAWVLLEQGRFFNRLSEYKNAVGVVETSLTWAKQSQDEEAEGMAHVLWGEALWRQGEYEAAEEKLTHVLTLGNRNNFTLITGWCHHHLGIICDIQSNYGCAIEHLEMACIAWNIIHYPQALSVSLNSMGLVAYHQGNLAHAQQAMEDALAICQRLDNRQFEANLLNNLSMMSTEQGAYSNARQYLKRALELANMNGDLCLQGNIYTNLGLNEHRANALELTVKYLEQGLQMFESIGERVLADECMFFLANAAKDQGTFDRAEILYEKSLAVAREVGARFIECQNLIGLASLFETSNRVRAIQFIEEAIALANLIQNPMLIERSHKVSASLLATVNK